jgi:hypothetical protein
MTSIRLSPPDAARRRFAIHQALIMSAFGLAMIMAGMWMPQLQEPWLRWLLALAPALLLSWWAWEFYKAVRADDEMMRALQYRITAISGVLVLLGGTIWGLLERLLELPGLWSFLLLPAFAVVHSAISLIEMRRM